MDPNCTGILTTDQWLQCATDFVQRGMNATVAVGSVVVALAIALAAVVLVKRVISLAR